LRIELEKALDEAKSRIIGMETAQESGWIVVDVFDVMVHLFSPPQREHYRLENLWKDAPEISVPGLLKPEKAATKRRAAPRKKKTPTA
jgi:ribosome-associated protein